MLQKRTNHDDILDAPLDEAEAPTQHIESFKLIYIELAIVVYSLVLVLGKFFRPGTSIKEIFIIILYCCLAPFFKPQFTKGSSLKIALGLWNCCNIGLFSFLILSGPVNNHVLFPKFVFISFILYLFLLPFVETTKLWNLKFYTILSFSLSFSVLFIGAILENTRANESLMSTASFIFALLAGISMLIQLKQNKKEHASYFFYFPRLVFILSLCIFAFFDKF